MDWYLELVTKGPAVVYAMAAIALFLLYKRQAEAHARELKELIGKYEALLREAVASLTQVAEELKRD